MAFVKESTTPLVGKVVAQDGTPIVGADLVLTSPTPGESPVVARGKSGAGGNYRFERPAGLEPTDQNLVPTLWAYAPGYRVAAIRFAKNVPSALEAVRVVLGPTAKTEIRVETPDGAPLAGARVNVQQTRSEPLPVPDPIVDLIERTTGPDGVALLDAFGPEEVGDVDVIARGFGTQPRWFDPARAGPKIVRLVPVVSLKGQLVVAKEQAGLARGWRIRAWTRRSPTNQAGGFWAGYGETKTDDDGRFALPEIAPGSLKLSILPPADVDLLPELPVNPVIHNDRENVLVIPLKKPSTVTGLVVEEGTGKPVVGMKVVLFRANNAGSLTVKTNAQGRYTFKTLPGVVSVWGPEAPPGYVTTPGLNLRGFNVSTAPALSDVGTTELLRAAPPLQGEVHDERGRPVAGVQVSGQWHLQTPRGNASGTAHLTTNEQGRFELEGVVPGAQVVFTASVQNRESLAPVVAVAGDGKPVTVTVLPPHLRPLPTVDLRRDRPERIENRRVMLAAILAKQRQKPAQDFDEAAGRARLRMIIAGVAVPLEMVQVQPQAAPVVSTPDFGDDDDEEEDVQVSRPQPQLLGVARNQWVMAPETFDRIVFEGLPDATVGHALLDAMLAAEIKDAARTYKLTPSQRVKLQLAGRGDIKRLLDRVEQGRRKFHVLKGNTTECMNLFRELQPVCFAIKQGPFFAGSLYSKTLTKMIADEPGPGRDSPPERP
jgi:hypothetical protein